MSYNPPREVLPNNIRMFGSQMTLHIIPTLSFIGLTNQAIVNYSFVYLVVSIYIRLCKEFQIALITFIISDSKMHFQMSSILISLHISVWTIAADVKVISMKSTMLIEKALVSKC